MKIHPALQEFFTYIFIKILVIFILIMSLYNLLIALKTKPREDYKFKINSFYLNWLFILLYISLFVVGFIILRYINIYNTVDLKNLLTFYHRLIILFTENPLNCIFICMVLTLVCLNILFMYLYMNKLLINELIKRHLYLLYQTTSYNPKLTNGNTLYNQIIFYFQHHLSINELFNQLHNFLTLNLFIFINDSLCKFTKENANLRKGLYYAFVAIKVSVIWGIPLMIPLLILYDCINNNGVLTKVFYYLFFYMLYSLWRRISNYIAQSTVLNLMFYELYYLSATIEYRDISEEGEALIYAYQANGLQHYATVQEDTVDVFNFYFFEVCVYNKFTSTDGKTFINSQGLAYIREAAE